MGCGSSLCTAPVDPAEAEKRAEEAQKAKEQRAVSMAIDRKLADEAIREPKRLKLLLLGTAECGKSTVLKQLRILYEEDFVIPDFAQMHVYSVIYKGIVELYEGAMQLQLPLPLDAERNYNLVKGIIKSGKDLEPLSAEIAQKIKALWNEESIQNAYAERDKLHITENIAHFLDDLDRISHWQYKIANEDFVRLRIPSTGVREYTIWCKDQEFSFMDFGGQRAERKRWHHHFDNVNAVIFLCAVSEYDQLLNEDNHTNRLKESMKVYRNTVNSPCFEHATFILFLNKIDIFEIKIRTKPITCCFPGYKGAQTYDESLGAIQRLFGRLPKDSESRNIYVHRTCATDNGQVGKIMNNVLDAVIRENLRGIGFR